MKVFNARFIKINEPTNDLSLISGLLDLEEKQHIDNLLWNDTGYRPEVSFQLGYTDNSILLKYQVKEKFIRAVYRGINDPVYKDSCVEMFIGFNNEPGYYHVEFNCVGTASVGYGEGKRGRVSINKNLVGKIKNQHYIKTSGDTNDINWELTLCIPFKVFEHSHINSMDGQVCRVNFYKCGDELPEPHYLSWNNITYPTPNFHLPQFFGEVTFVADH